MAFEHEGIKQIEANELKEIIKAKQKDVVVIDVRENDEYEAGHIPGIPLIPMGNIPNILGELRQDKEYVFVCRSGNRSHNVARFLKQYGFKVQNFYGGMIAWDDEVREGFENVITDTSKLYKE